MEDLKKKCRELECDNGNIRSYAAKLERNNAKLIAACKSFIDLFRESDMRPEDECHELYDVIKEAYDQATES